MAVTSFFGDKPLIIDDKISVGKIDDYVTPTFYAPNVSWFVQRNGMHPRHSLMISLNASKGNHMHANGISMGMMTALKMIAERMAVSGLCNPMIFNGAN